MQLGVVSAADQSHYRPDIDREDDPEIVPSREPQALIGRQGDVTPLMHPRRAH
jgi:hypothetical protein